MPEKQNNPARPPRRLRERIALALPVRVQVRETTTCEWTEMSRLVDVTPFGARLRLKRPIDLGRLLHLTMKMPRQLRCYDHVEDQYRIWSVVRNLKALDPEKYRGAMVEVGVAFVGKRAPKSFEEDPTRRYDISKTESGMWMLQEGSAQTATADDRRSSETEATVTEDLGRQGAAVFTALVLEPGRFVRVSSHQLRQQMLAVVRARTTGPDGIGRLHLEFIGCEWPL